MVSGYEIQSVGIKFNCVCKDIEEELTYNNACTHLTKYSTLGSVLTFTVAISAYGVSAKVESIRTTFKKHSVVEETNDDVDELLWSSNIYEIYETIAWR